MDRRGFLNRLAGLLQAAVGLAVVLPGLRFLLAPLRRSTGTAAFLSITPLPALAPHRPVRVSVTTHRRDAFTHYPPGPIGSVWLIRDSAEGEPAAVRCFQTICPHLGCGIDFAADREAFVCPCHAGEFDLAGEHRAGPPPRGMDSLECRVTDADDSGQPWIEVKYEAFTSGTTDKRPVAS